MRVAIFLPPMQAAQIRTALDTEDGISCADSWEVLESIIRLEPLSVVVFNPAADGVMDVSRACRLIRDYDSIPFIAYVPGDAPFLRGIARMSNEGLRDVVVHRFDDSPPRFRDILARASMVPELSMLVEAAEPSLPTFPASLPVALLDDLRNPHRYACAEDLARAAKITLSALYRSFRHARLNSPKSFVVGARVFRGYVYLKDRGFSVGDVAIKLGYTHPRIFAHHIEAVLGECPSQLRHCLSDAEAIRRVVCWMGVAENPLEETSSSSGFCLPPVRSPFSLPSTSGAGPKLFA